MLLSEDEPDGLRPWRKRALQIITTEIWRKVSLEEVVPLPQVAGHGSHDSKQAILTNKNGCILKPVQAPPRGHREMAFYTEVFSSTDPEVTAFRSFLPNYFGTCKKRIQDGTVAEFLIIENLTNGMEKPCVMDVKMGARTYGPDATPDKISKQQASYAGTKGPFGFSVLGMSLYTGPARDTFTLFNQSYGQSLNKDNIHEFLEHYLDSRNEKIASAALKRIFISKFEEITSVFEVQRKYHVFGSSLLFVYDAATVTSFLAGSCTEHQMADSVCLKMIDFAHVWPGEGQRDENYLFGLRNLTNLFKNSS